MTSVSPDNRRSSAELDEPTAAPADAGLRNALRLNGGFSILTGTIAVALGGPVATVLGVEQTWLIRAIGIGLLGFAAGLFLLATASPERVRREALHVSIADLGWVAATVVVIAAGWLSTAGAVIMGLIGLVVADFAVVQLMRRKAVGR